MFTLFRSSDFNFTDVSIVYFSIVTERVETLVFTFCGSQGVIRLWGEEKKQTHIP